MTYFDHVHNMDYIYYFWMYYNKKGIHWSHNKHYKSQFDGWKFQYDWLINWFLSDIVGDIILVVEEVPI